jgi:dTDP-4-amino-4,6-dideoxygalactose transaminase
MTDKKTLNDLAFFGGSIAFDEIRHVGGPNVGDRSRLMDRINDLLDRRWLTNNGPYVEEFERRIAQTVGVKHCVAMCNATVALEITVRALALTGEVIVPSMTFIATAHALFWQHLTPVFCDIETDSFTLDPDRIEELVTPSTSAILGVHLWGRPCRIDKLVELAQKYDLELIFDAAHAFGCSWNGRMIGGFGVAEVFSFHATKFLNTFEGGAVVTHDDDLAAKLRVMKNFGFAGYDAAMGLTGLESLDEFIVSNCGNYQQYCDELSDLNGVTLPAYDSTQKNNYQYVVLLIDDHLTGISRDQLMDLLWAENVRARRYFYPGCHRMQPYHFLFPLAGKKLPITEDLLQRLLLLPTGTTISTQDISKICQIIRFAVSHGEEIKQRMSGEVGAHAG